MEKKLLSNFIRWLDNNGYNLIEDKRHCEFHNDKDGNVPPTAELIDRYITMELPYES